MAQGEGIIQAGEKEYRVLFNNRALAEAEGQMGKSVIGLLRVAQETQDIAITDLAHLLRAGMQAARRDGGGRAATLIEAYTILDKAGFGHVMEIVLKAIAGVLGHDSRKEAAGDDEEEDPNG